MELGLVRGAEKPLGLSHGECHTPHAPPGSGSQRGGYPLGLDLHRLTGASLRRAPHVTARPQFTQFAGATDRLQDTGLSPSVRPLPNVTSLCWRLPAMRCCREACVPWYLWESMARQHM
jgi:hypothetical protein